MVLVSTRALTVMSKRGYRQPVCKADKLTTFMYWLSQHLGALIFWNPRASNRPAQGLCYLCNITKNMSSYRKNLRSVLSLKTSKRYILMKSGFKDWESITYNIHTAYSKHTFSKFDAGTVLSIHILNCTSCTVILKIIVKNRNDISHKFLVLSQMFIIQKISQ